MLRSHFAIPFLFLFACTPYNRFSGEFNAGPVDPSKFPPAYLGSGGDPKLAGGTFTPNTAFVAGTKVNYYVFPLGSGQASAKDPLATSNFAPPLAYVFDPAANDPNASPQRCVAPANYNWTNCPQDDPDHCTQRTDAVRMDQQGNLFTALPSSAAYVPIVAEVPVTSAGEACQSIKTTDTLIASNQVSVKSQVPKGAPSGTKPVGVRDGKLIAWAIIDPSAIVNPTDPVTGLGPQEYGWYQHYLVVYIDGGYVPVNGGDLVAQNLYVPNHYLGTDANGNPAVVASGGTPGTGFDVLQATRGSAGYSPVCHIFTFDGDPKNLPTDATKIENATDTMTFTYCFQTK
jgi:hypothetical protein